MLTKKPFVDVLLCAGFIFLSFLLYLYRLAEITPGVWGDEVALGSMVNYLNSLGSFTPFISHNLGHPTPLIYLSSFFISVLGKNVISLRIVSVIFGALSIGLFYLFLRYTYSRFMATSGTFLFASSYVFVIVARFAYEMSAAIFFLIASSFLFFVFMKKPTKTIIVFLGLTLGAGLYTYLAFRTICLVFIGILIAFLLHHKKNMFQYVFLFFLSFIIVLLPLITFSFRHFNEVNQRVQTLSVFNQQLPKGETIKELKGAATRTLTLFTTTGDPNPRQNPANTIPFDYGTLLVFLTGLIVLIKNKPWMGYSIMLLIITILVTEIVTLEQIPDFHYYGLGHPNTLRISPLVPIIIFVAVYGLWYLQKIVKNKRAAYIGIFLLVMVISAINLRQYYFQKPNQWIYMTNYVSQLRIIELLNKNKPKIPVAVSSTLFTSHHMEFFLDPSIQRIPIANPLDCSFHNLEERISIILAQDLSNCSREQLQTLMENPSYQVTGMTNPWNTYDALILTKR